MAPTNAQLSGRATAPPSVLLLPILALLFAAIAILATPSASQPAPEPQNLTALTTEELADLDASLASQLSSLDAEIRELRGDTARIRSERDAASKEAESLQGARDWELAERKKREEELAKTRREVAERQAAMAKLSVHVNELKNEIASLQAKMGEISARKRSSERRYYEPSLADVLDTKASHWDDLSRHVYNKTMTKVLPVVTQLSDRARKYYLEQMSTTAVMVVGAILYGFCIGWVALLYKLFTVLRGRVTVSKLLFLGDVSCSAFWGLVLLCYLFLRADPLYVLQIKSETVFFMFQIWAIVAYVCFVLLRVLVLAAKMTLGALGELLTVIVIGHHYYIRVWQPAMVDAFSTGGPVYYYVCYAWMFAAFAYSRSGEVVGHAGAREEGGAESAAGEGTSEERVRRDDPVVVITEGGRDVESAAAEGNRNVEHEE